MTRKQVLQGKTGSLRHEKKSGARVGPVPVLKADGKVRVCGDYKLTVNRVSHLEQYPIPTLDDLCEKLTGGKQFSKLDLSHAYSQLPLDNKSKEYATVNTHRGLFRYNRLPYGINSAPAIFGVVLSHVMEVGTERPMGFASRTLNAAEKNYSQLDKEGAAVMFALKKFHKHLYGRSFEIITDHKPLVSLFAELKQVPTTASPRIQRWAVTLCGNEYNIHYKVGQSHNNADCLSRLPLPVTVKSEPEEHVLLIEELDCSPVSAEQISRYTVRDPITSSRP